MPAMATRFLEARFAWARTALDSPARTTRSAVVVGRLLGLAFVVCFATGMYSHALQDPLPWMVFPTRPTWIYQWTQGLHVISGTAAIPLLLGKLWIVYPRLFSWPPLDSPLHGLERLSIAMLVSSSLVQVAIGFLNTLQWYPWEFSFRRVHLALAWVVIGSLAVHVAAKLPQIVAHWRRDRGETPRPTPRIVRPATPDANDPTDPVGADAPATATTRERDGA
ncbi:hypothetical protein SAMN04489720_0851 [Agrococcus jejuensis]|uniref:Cytochrome b561 n=1 Tax=Agrococcus jejuensis TaxID=399736 RepID=A0A1G8BD49_9MICO|nr:hypothetical protein SAMN04489720_0851 [Agrococcus jejuensis]